MPPATYRGLYGEAVAASYLRAKDYRILRQRFRYGSGGEIDLVCRKGDTLVFVEVKSSISTAGGAPARRVTREKRNLIRRGARNWLRLLHKDVPYRFDMVEVLLPAAARPVITHTEHAFTLQEGAAWSAAHAE